MLLFITLFHALFSLSKVTAIPDHAVVISVSADDEFKLFANNKIIGMGDHYDEVYKFYTELEHGSKLRVEGVDIHAQSGYNTRSLRGIILSTSAGLVTNSNWRCIENNGSVLPDVRHWPFSVELGNNDANSKWGRRPEILTNASWIWAPKLSSGHYPSKVACVPSRHGRCIDKGCEPEWGGQGVCVDFSPSSDVNFTSLADQFDLKAGSKSGLCGGHEEGKEHCCHCLKKIQEEEPGNPQPSVPYANLIALGGDTLNGPTKVVEKLHSEDNDTFSELPAVRFGHSAFVHPVTKDVLVCGGKGKNHGTDTFRDCIAHNSNWSCHSTLTEPRMHASTVVMESGDVYILGGEFSPDTSDVLRSDLKTWTVGPKLDHPTYMACATDLNATSFVTIGGGVSEYDVSLYNTVTKSWSKPWPQLREGRRGHCCARVHNKVIVAGGYLYGAHKNTATTLLIDINTGRAYASLRMKEARSFFTMHSFERQRDRENGILVAIGGNVPQKSNNNTEAMGYSNTVEVWNLSTSVGWHYEEGFQLTTGTGHFATVVVQN